MTDEQAKALQDENARLKGEKPIPFAWWSECPELAQRTMERIIAENARLKALLEHSKTQLEYDELQAENESLCNLVEDVRAEAHQVKEDYRTDAVLQAENEKARLFRLEVQEAVEALIGCEDDKALKILEQALKG